MSDREEWVAKNEAASREINEKIEDAHEETSSGQHIRMVCECGQENCDRVVAITLVEYERLRGDPRQFVVARDHVMADVERVGFRDRSLRDRGETGGHAGGRSHRRGSQRLGSPRHALFFQLQFEPVSSWRRPPPARQPIDQVQPPSGRGSRRGPYGPGNPGWAGRSRTIVDVDPKLPPRPFRPDANPVLWIKPGVPDAVRHQLVHK